MILPHRDMPHATCPVNKSLFPVNVDIFALHQDKYQAFGASSILGLSFNS